MIKYHSGYLIGRLNCIFMCSESYHKHNNSHTRSDNQGVCNCSWDDFYFVVRILRMHGATRAQTTWTHSGDQWLLHIFRVQWGWIDESITIWEWTITWVSNSSTSVWQKHYLVIRQSQLSEARTIFAPQKVLIGNNNYMTCGVSIVIQVEAAAVDTL
jgi:hypothetical protein